MDFKKLFRKDDKAVSPVIGVILMVAITVILAAAIGSSVFSHTGSKSAPQANLDMKSAGIDTAGVASVKIEHLGGDVIDFANSANLTASVNGKDSVFVNAKSIGELNAGDVKVIQLKDLVGTTITVVKGDTVNLKVSDTETKQLISDRDVKFL